MGISFTSNKVIIFKSLSLYVILKEGFCVVCGSTIHHYITKLLLRVIAYYLEFSYKKTITTVKTLQPFVPYRGHFRNCTHLEKDPFLKTVLIDRYRCSA